MEEPASGSPTDRAMEESIADHRSLMQLVGDLEACLGREPDREGAWLGELRTRLTSLRDSMKEHFEAEERGPIFRSVPLNHPRLAARLENLEAEHAELLSRTEDILQRARELETSRIYDLRHLNAHAQLLVASGGSAPSNSHRRP